MVGKGAKLKSLLFKPYSQAGLHESAGKLYRLNTTLHLGENGWNEHYGGDQLVRKHFVEKGIIATVKHSPNSVRLELVADEGKLAWLQEAHKYLSQLPIARPRPKKGN